MYFHKRCPVIEVMLMKQFVVLRTSVRRMLTFSEIYLFEIV